MPEWHFFMAKNNLNSEQSELEKLSKLIKKYESQLEKGKKVVDLIDKYNKIFEEFESKQGEGIPSLLVYSQEVKDKLDNLQKQASESLNQVNQSINEARLKTDEMNSVYGKFTVTRDQINNSETGLQALFSKSNELSTQIREIRSSTDQILNQINSTLESVKKRFDEIDTLYKEFVSIREKISDPESGLQALTNLSIAKNNELESIKGQADKLFSEIVRIKDDSNNFLKDIKNSKQQAEDATNKIVKHEKESEEYKIKIANIWEVATGSGLANSFHERKKELALGVIIWAVLLILGVIAYISLLIWIYQETFRNGVPTIDSAAWYRLTITLPILFLVVFASIQYSKERGLLEKYAFKSATAIALEAYMLVLTTKFDKFELEIVEFVLNSMKMIYKEPHDKEKKYKMNFGINKVFNIGLEENRMEELEDFLEEKAKDKKAKDKKEEKNNAGKQSDNPDC